jgi:hypothetical protein
VQWNSANGYGGLAQDVDRRCHALQVVHAGAQQDRPAERCDVTDERVVVALARADLVGGEIEVPQAIRRGPGKGRAEPEQPFVLGVRLQVALLSAVERATGHDVPDRLRRVARDDIAAGIISSSMTWLWNLTHSQPAAAASSIMRRAFSTLPS